MNNKSWDSLWINAAIATMVEGATAYGLCPEGALAVKEGRIAWVGPLSDLKRDAFLLANEVHDVAGRLMTPGLIDCHTHIVYAGTRADEWTMRSQGKTYAEIARAGGGILSTVSATRQAPYEELLQQSLKRVRSLMDDGVTTIEIKSGYGLDLATELKMLQVAKKIGQLLKVRVKTTFLGAHAVPPEFSGRPDDYIDFICHDLLPEVAGQSWADCVDVFCESMAFNLKQTEQVFKAAKKLKCSIKCHAEQLSNSGAAALAAEFQALSVDHLEYLSEKDIKAIAASKTTAVLLPGAYYFLGEKKRPPVELLRQYGVPIAIASDCNPGTSPISSMLFILNSACVLFGLSPEEALAGVTRNAAKALGMFDELGTLSVGKVADFVIWDVPHPNELIYWIGGKPLYQVHQAAI